MEVAMPMASAGTVAAMDCYEDMFKEITRKLYGEDGLPDLASGERLTGITTTAERGLTNIDYDVESSVFKPEEHITAFGLAALMQNGFPSAGILNPSFQQVNKPNSTVEDKWVTNEDNLQWTQSKIASYNPSQKLFKCADCECVGFLARVAEHWLGTHANLRVFQCPQCPYASAWARCVRMHLARQHNVNAEETVDTFLKENPVMHEITRYLQKLKTKYEANCTKVQCSTPSTATEDFQQNNSQPTNSSQRINSSNSSPSVSAATESTGSGSANGTTKRYSCIYCPYATDRRDLFTRHENIHREEKPFQCYVCQKQFNRADHVKKHFLRMHREHPYDLNRIRRHPPKNASGMSYYHKYNSSGNTTPTSSEPMPNAQQGIQHPLTIPNGFGAISRVGQNLPMAKPTNTQTSKPSTMKPNSTAKSGSKKKGDKRYSCCYCSWSGVDNWCLKRHLNTHLKPFVCGLCDYKAARSERLATHVLKVHNKRACGRCLYLADDQAQLTVHQQEHHPLEQRNNRSSSNNVLRNTSFNSTTNPTNQSFGQSLSSVTPGLKPYEISAAILQHGSRLLPMTGSLLSNTDTKPWKPYTPKQHGAARLFNYMEASDGSEPECDTSNEDLSRMTNATQRNHSDFPEAGDVGIQHQGDQEEFEEEMELPLFICRECGCEFLDDTSLETHTFTHHRVEKISTSPANQKPNRKLTSYKNNAAKTSTASSGKSNIESKENINPKSNYICMICKLSFVSQTSIMKHMRSHVTLNYGSKEQSGKMHSPNSSHKKNNDCSNDSATLGCYQDNLNANGTFKRSRKQSQPRKVVPPFCENQEIKVMKGTSLKHRQWQCNNDNGIATLRDKYMNKLINRRGLSCVLCKKNKSMFPYHTKGSLALHYAWKHMDTKTFECEHCSMKFRHRYQVVLHSSREHVHKTNHQTSDAMDSNSQLVNMETDTDKQTVPKLITKEPILCNVTVPASDNLQNNDTILTTNVPDNSATNISVDKLTMHSYLGNSMMNPNNVINNHMPITIPTFPPS